MKDEIKEISKADKKLLDKIEYILGSELSSKEYDVFYNYFNEIRKPNILIDIKDDENIKDYITNLQEELDGIKDNFKIQLEYDEELENKITNLQEENEKLNNIIDELIKYIKFHHEHIGKDEKAYIDIDGILNIIYKEE